MRLEKSELYYSAAVPVVDQKKRSAPSNVLVPPFARLSIFSEGT